MAASKKKDHSPSGPGTTTHIGAVSDAPPQHREAMKTGGQGRPKGSRELEPGGTTHLGDTFRNADIHHKGAVQKSLDTLGGESESFDGDDDAGDDDDDEGV